jgi:hypothetical protein
MTNIKIKYLDGFEVYDYYDSSNHPTAEFKDFWIDRVKTIRKWEHVLDSNRDNRIIQGKIYEIYEIADIVARNINLYRFTVSNQIYVTPEIGDPFYAVNVTVKYKGVESSLDKLATVTFWKEIDLYKPLSNTYAEEIHSNISVNYIEFIAKNPPFVFNNVNVLSERIFGSHYLAYFDVPRNEYTENLANNDTFYLHSNNTDFNAETDDSGDYLNFGLVSNSGSGDIRIYCSNDNVGESFSYNVNDIVLDNEESYPEPYSGFTANNKEITVKIYTFLKPYLMNPIEPGEEKVFDDRTKENQDLNSKYNAILKAWLSDGELWRAEFLHYALKEDTKLVLNDGTIIKPSQIKDIIEPIPNENLIELHPFTVRFIYKNVLVNYFRNDA